MRPELASAVLRIAYGVMPVDQVEVDRRAERLTAALVTKIYVAEAEEREVAMIDLGGES